VIVRHPNPKAKQYEKIEDPEYCKKHGDLVKIDPYYYLEALVKPLDQLLGIVYQKPRCVDQILTQHLRYRKVVHMIQYGDLRFTI
jgi:predicted amino acid racemase